LCRGLERPSRKSKKKKKKRKKRPSLSGGAKNIKKKTQGKHPGVLGPKKRLGRARSPLLGGVLGGFQQKWKKVFFDGKQGKKKTWAGFFLK